MEPIKLKDQLPDEVVVKVVRRDIMVLVKKLVSFLIVLAVIIAGVVMFFNTFPTVAESQYYPLLVLFGFGFAFFAWLFFFLSITDFVLDVWYITNKRIIDVQQEGFFSRKVAEQYLNRIQDVTSETVGILPTIFKYGNVRVQTAGEHEQFLFGDVSEPDQVRQMIMELIQKSQNPNAQAPTL
jgi:uncharacterized membrane protein YdbT with pleckstrin-like domain